MAVQLMSNVKIITSGNKPTTENLTVGQAAFGKITSDGLYHLFGNSDGKVIDLVLSTASGIDAFDIDQVLTQGNTTDLSIQFDNESGNVVVIGTTGLTATNGTRQLSINPANGFQDAGKPVLSANPANTISPDDATTMRNFLTVYSKTEVDGEIDALEAKITGVYKYKGTIKSFAALVAQEEYTPAVGDVWNIETAGGVDKNGQAIKAGDNVAFVGPEKATDWDVLAGVVDLTNYYTKTEVNGLLSPINTSITGLDNDMTAVEGRLDTIEGAGYQTAAQVQQILTDGHYVSDENYVHTDKNYTAADAAKVAKIVDNGDGTKVLTDNGTYQPLAITVEQI